MDIPVNTAVVDYRIQRRIGYWDGQGLSENPVPGGIPLAATSTRRPLLLIAVNVGVVLAVLLAIWYRRRLGTAS